MKAVPIILFLLLAANYQAIVGGHTGLFAILVGHALVAGAVWLVWWASSSVVRWTWGQVRSV